MQKAKRRTRPSQKGKEFEREIAESLGSFELAHPKDFWWRRWPDYRDWIAISPRLFAPKAPCDFMALYEGRFFALEAKSTHGERYQFDWIKEHQKDHLLRIQCSGGHGYLLFSYRKRPASIACALPITTYIILEGETIELGKKSIGIDEIFALGTPLSKIAGLWDLEPILDPLSHGLRQSRL